MKWFKKEHNKQPKTRRAKQLIIKFKHNSLIPLEITIGLSRPTTGKLIKPFIPFYKWFFGRSSRYYRFSHDQGEVMIDRKQIISFRIEWINVPIQEL